MSKILAVFGATGNQGGSVIRAVLANPALSKEFKIRAITRDVTKPAAKDLAAKGVEVVSADLSKPEQLAPALKDAHTVVLITNFWESVSVDVEVAQGKAATDAAKAAGVQHVIFSSLIDAKEASKGRLPNIAHFDGKADIESYIRESGVPATFWLPGFFMANLVDSLKKQEDGSYLFATPTSDAAKVPLFDAVKDTGRFITAIIEKHPAYLGKRILAATDYYSPSRIVSEFTEVTGKPAKSIQVPEETFKSFLPDIAAQSILENMLLLEEPGYYGGEDLEESLAVLNGKPTAWKDFVAENKEKWA